MNTRIEYAISQISFCLTALFIPLQLILQTFILIEDERSKVCYFMLLGLAVTSYHHLLLALRYQMMTRQAACYNKLLLLPLARVLERCLGPTCSKLIGLLAGIVYAILSFAWRDLYFTPPHHLEFIFAMQTYVAWVIVFYEYTFALIRLFFFMLFCLLCFPWVCLMCCRGHNVSSIFSVQEAQSNV